MFLAPSSRPKLTRVIKEQPHDVRATVGNVTVTPLDTLTVTPGGEEGVQLPAFFVATAANGGSNSNPGTEAEPFETITKARDEMRNSSNPTVIRTYIRGGTHSVTSALSLNSNDSSTEWLAYPTETPIIDAQNNQINTFSNTGGSSVTFDGLKFINTPFEFGDHRFASIAYSGSGAANGVVKNCTFEDVNVGVSMKSGANNGKILGCTFNNISLGTMHIESVDSQIIAGCHATNISTGATFFNSLFSMIWSRGVTNALYEYNTCNGADYSVINFSGPNRNNSGCTIRYCEAFNFCQEQTDGGAFYTLGRGGTYTSFTIDSCWAEGGGTDTITAVNGYYLDDGSTGITIQNCVGVNNRQAFCQVHGGNNNTITNSIGLLVAGVGNVSRFSPNEYGIWWQDGNLFDVGMTGNVVDKNIWYSINSDRSALSYGNEKWTLRSGSSSSAIGTVENNVLHSAMNLDDEETSSTQSDPLWDNFDPTNKILELNVSSPAFTEGFVNIVGVTDGGTYTWGSITSNSNSGYDEDNY